jgi:secondary thiamine-phosphate synthase enzyme
VAVNEKFDPAVREDILQWLERAVPQKGAYSHEEGNSDAHIKSLLVGNQAMIPVRQGNLLLGRWQGVFFLDFDGPRARTLWVTFIEGQQQEK